MDEAGGGDMFSARDRNWIRRAALHYLERYASSEANLARVLKRKVRRRWEARRESAREAGGEGGEPPPAEAVEALIAEAAAHCRSLGLLDDRAFAETKVASARRKGQSATRISATLAAKGVDRETAAAAIDAEETDDRTAMLRLARRRRLGPFRTRDTADARAADARDIAAACRAGFSFRLARWAVGLDRETAESILAGEDNDAG